MEITQQERGEFMSVLTREEMVRIIRDEHGSIMHNGTVISTIAELPKESELAKGDPKLEAAARESLVQQKADIEAQLKSLEDSKKAFEESKKAEAKDSKKEDSKKDEVKK